MYAAGVLKKTEPREKKRVRVDSVCNEIYVYAGIARSININL